MGRIALGTAGFSIEPQGRDREADLAAIRLAVDAGLTLLDGARAYAPAGDATHNERLLADAVGGRADVLVGTKGGHFRVSASEWGVENTPERMRADVELSLATLGGDALELFYIHRADGSDDLTEAIGELDTLRREGKLRRVGLSNVSPEQLRAALAQTTVDAVQNRFSAIGRESAEVLALCEQHGVPFFAYSPVRRSVGTTIEDELPALTAYARERGADVYALLLALLLDSSSVMSVVSGATRPQTIAASASAAQLHIDDAARAAYASDLELSARA